MHEYSIVQAMFDQIGGLVRAHHAIAVRRVRVRLGRLAGVDPALLRTAYGVFRERTICDAAPLEIDEVDPIWTCVAGHGAIAPGAGLACPACGGRVRMAAGDEIVLDALDLEVP